MTIVFVSTINDYQLSIRDDFEKIINDLGVACVDKGRDGWADEMMELISIVRGPLNRVRLGGSTRDMALHLIHSYSDKPFNINSYDASAEPGTVAMTRSIIDSEMLPPHFLIQSALYDIASGEAISEVLVSLREKVASTVDKASKSADGDADKAVSLLIGNQAVTFANQPFMRLFAPLYKDGPILSQQFLDECPERAVGVFAELAKKAYPDLEIELEIQDTSEETPSMSV